MGFTTKTPLGDQLRNVLVIMMHKRQDSKYQSCYCVLILPPMTVVKQSPFSLVPKLGYIRSYAVSMMCFTLLLVCPEVSYSSKHNHFLSTALEQEPDRGALRVCLFISVSDIQFLLFSDTFFPKHENQAEPCVYCTVAHSICFSFSTLTL